VFSSKIEQNQTFMTKIKHFVNNWFARQDMICE